ncbi:uncharacterized protein LOC110104299 [Dendrobium catenatum]|uniref:uncharacterized protein LOC110104299 n=1 Tax=Dendrobium catenatum TaxID=906689 RepID=UPI0010A04CA9|nr:uncharacterized protein LOC110104299 [Dendrobium catenatum]
MRRAMAAIGPFAALRNRILKPRNPLIFHPYSFPTSLQRIASFSPSTTSASISSSSLSSSPSLSSLGSGNTLCSSTSYNYINLEPYLVCSMLGRRLKVAVLLSGGVDSSVALRLLHAAGHSCTAFYLKIWFQEDFANFWSECPWDEDLKYARAVCDQVDVPLEVVHLSDEYWRNVVSHIIEEYHVGRTPNPDVLCNTRIKFGAFLEAIENMGFDYIASGHYAYVNHSSCSAHSGSSVLALSKDMLKDQTYFLSHLSQFQLRRLLFPLGCLSKDEVRYLATQMDLPNNERKDSQGICFLGKVKFSEFVARHIGEMEGLLLEAETGDYLGNHRGFWFYTIGQRHGLRLPGGPWYVVEKDVQNNVVFVSRNYFSLDKRRRKFRVGSLKWFGGSTPDMQDRLRCKYADMSCRIMRKILVVEDERLVYIDGESPKGAILAPVPWNKLLFTSETKALGHLLLHLFLSQFLEASSKSDHPALLLSTLPREARAWPFWSQVVVVLVGPPECVFLQVRALVF